MTYLDYNAGFYLLPFGVVQASTYFKFFDLDDKGARFASGYRPSSFGIAGSYSPNSGAHLLMRPVWYGSGALGFGLSELPDSRFDRIGEFSWKWNSVASVVLLLLVWFCV